VGSFPWPEKLGEEQRAIKVEAAKGSATTLAEHLAAAKRCYAPELTEDMLVEALVRCVEDSGAFENAITSYQNMFPDMIALQHVNCHPENCYFWRNGQDRLDCGMFDWGGAAPRNVISTMMGSITACEGEVMAEHEDGLMRCFRDEYYQECGIWLNLREMVRQWHLCLCVKLLVVARAISEEVYPSCALEEWAKIDSLEDERVVSNGNIRAYSFMIKVMLAYLRIRWEKGGKKNLHIHDVFNEWKAHWVKQGLT
jgi:hypothetical protein